MKLRAYFKTVAPRYEGRWVVDEQDTNGSRIENYADKLSALALNSGHFEDIPACDINDAATEYVTRESS